MPHNGATAAARLSCAPMMDSRDCDRYFNTLSGGRVQLRVHDSIGLISCCVVLLVACVAIDIDAGRSTRNGKPACRGIAP
jgi:hypothetical protein